MPERDWREDLVTGLGVVLGIVILFAIGWDYIELETRQRVIQHYDAQGDANKTDGEIAEFCDSLSGPERVKCFSDQIESRAKQDKDTRDLHAQEWMALWAKWMTLAAIGGTIAALYGLFLLRRTWVEAKRTADVTRDIGEAQVRGYLGFVEGNQFFNTKRIQVDIHKAFFLKFQNTGASPISAQAHDASCNLVDYATQKTLSFDMIATLKLIEVDPEGAREFHYRAEPPSIAKTF